MTIKIYKKDTKGNTRVWSQEQDGPRFPVVIDFHKTGRND